MPLSSRGPEVGPATTREGMLPRYVRRKRDAGRHSAGSVVLLAPVTWVQSTAQYVFSSGRRFSQTLENATSRESRLLSQCQEDGSRKRHREGGKVLAGLV